jgi:hypothetical protein
VWWGREVLDDLSALDDFFLFFEEGRWGRKEGAFDLFFKFVDCLLSL